MIIFCVALFAVGHMVRDGQPSFKAAFEGKYGRWLQIVDVDANGAYVPGTRRLDWLYHWSTHLARFTGALLCSLGALSDPGLTAALLVLIGIWVGFYADMKHGEAAGVDTPVAVFDSFLSGITSLIPLAGALAWLHHSPWCAMIWLVGLLKPLIWKAAWLSNCQRLGWFWEPTRIAAMVFGAAIGLAVGLIA